MYRRKIEEELKAWKNSAQRKPLVRAASINTGWV